MRKTTLLTIIAALLLGGLQSWARTADKVIVAYVTAWTDVMPDPAAITHINYAFGHVNKTFDGVDIANPYRLLALSQLKKNDPDLKILLSIGGWGSGRFSEMAADHTLRSKFAQDCLNIVREFNLDGIDIDWEYPGTSVAGISSSPHDIDNFTLLIKQLRDTLGNDRLVTIATAGGAAHVDFQQVAPYLDYVNIMAYDMADAPKHHAALYPSDNTPEVTCDESVRRHIAKGVPADKLVLGVPFYGRGGKEMKGARFGKLSAPEGYTFMFDETAKAPFLVNGEGVPVIGFDDARSLNYKCDFIIEKGLRGVMYWEYSGDDEQGTLRNTLARRLKNTK